MPTIHETTLGKEQAGERIDRFLALFCSVSRNQAQGLIHDGAVTLNGVTVKANARLKEGDTLHVEIPDPVPLDVLAQDIALDIYYEDEDVLVVNKPVGMVVHPAAGNRDGTLVNALLHHCDNLSGIGGVLRPGIVHRIDKDTSGLLVVTKNDRAHEALSLQFAAHSLEREYLALCIGAPKQDEGSIDRAITRHPTDRKRYTSQGHNGKRAITHFKVLRRYAEMSFISARLETGRTHQIRVHFTDEGFPLLGDPVYGGERKLNRIQQKAVRDRLRHFSRQALHAHTLGFRHPRTGEMLRFECDLPSDMADVLDFLEQHHGKLF